MYIFLSVANALFFFFTKLNCVQKDVVIKYVKRVRHPRCYKSEAREAVRLEIGWATIGNYEDYGIYAMRHMMGIIEDRWDVLSRCSLKWFNLLA
ncbi:hypothetical protein Hanom_Chr07g00629111 [Helianthus anomalus]